VKCNCSSQLLQKNFAPFSFVRYHGVDGGEGRQRLALQPAGCTHVAAHASPGSAACMPFQPQPILDTRKTCVSLLRKEIESGGCEAEVVCSLQQLGAVLGALAYTALLVAVCP